jgi:hypothetical protein
MSPAHRKVVASMGLTMLFLLSLSTGLSNSLNALEPPESVEASTPLGQASQLTIGSWPDGANQRVEVSVPDQHAIKSIDLSLESSSLSNPIGQSWTETGDFASNAVYDGMDVNTSTLSILPTGAFWDFENAAHGWSLGGGGSVWKVGYDSTIGASAGVSSGSNALYTYDGNYPNRMSQYWATSPTIDCSGCSGSWTLSYMRMLGVESSSWDRAYVQAKNAQGTWSNVWSNSGTLNENSYRAVSHSVTNYVSNNPNFAIRFGLGTTDSSVTYTGWNIDDVKLEPTGGSSGTGEGNWTSGAFGPTLLGRGESMMHGFLDMDATVYPGSVFEWQVLDATTMVPVAGFERLTGTSVDLGMIDWNNHPLLRLKIHMKEASGGGAPEVRSISYNGILTKTFDSDPTMDGWQIQSGSWSNGAITSNGDVLTKTYDVRSGFSGIRSSSVLSGQGQLEYSLDEGTTWSLIEPQQTVSLSQPAFSVQFRATSTGGSYTWDTFDVELLRTSLPQGLRLDVGLDGAAEWSMDKAHLGPLGLQHGLTSGDMWASYPIEPARTASAEVALPLSGVDAFSFAMSSPTAVVANPFLAMAVNGQDILSRNLQGIGDLTEIRLTGAELDTLNDALSQAEDLWHLPGLPMATVELRVGSSLSTTTLNLGGIFAPYDGVIDLDLNAANPLVMGLNNVISDIVPVSGQRVATLPVRMDGTGSVYLTVNDVVTQSSVKALTLDVLNVTDTFVPGNDWIEATGAFDFSPIGVSDALTHARQSGWDVELQLAGDAQQSRLTCPITSLPVTATNMASCSASGTALVWFDEGVAGSISATGSGQFLEVKHHFKFPDGWNDESSAVLSVHLISSTGPMLPVTALFGLGHDQGVENDIEVKSWSVVSPEGIRSSPVYPYLRAGEVVNVEVVMGFEGTDEGTPRSGQALIRFLVDGNEYATTTLFEHGVASFAWNVPAGRPSIDLGVEVVPLRGQDVVSQIDMSHTFLFDNVAPTLMQTNVDRYDTRDASPLNQLEFLVADRPHLPTHALGFVWRSWMDDLNGNGVLDAGEEVTKHLTHPTNMSMLMGTYTLNVDSSDASTGDFFIGWIEIADSAGHVMEGGGTLLDPMFHVQLNSNGAPSLGATSLGWPDGARNPWFHPGETNQIRVPVWEQNSIYDLAEIHLALASNTAQPSVVTWNQSTQSCTSSHAYIELSYCELEPTEADDLFSRNGEFVVNFTIEWGYDPDTSLVRVPEITMRDQSGQTNMFKLEPLGWQFSGELAIDHDSIRIGLPNEDPSSMGYWVQPRTSFEITGDLVWYRTGVVPQQDLDVTLTLGEYAVDLPATNGTFTGSLLTPLSDGAYGLFGDLFDAPNGAVYRGDESAFVWFIVDNEAPRVTAVDRPVFNNVLSEEMWNNLQFELRLTENARLDESTLFLHWSLNEAGLGLNSYIFDNGTVPLTVMGERLNGESIPVQCTLDLDALMLPVFRTKAVELRIWVTGSDEAGQTIDSVFNDVDAPLRVWALEQRVPEFTLSPVELKPGSEIRQGDVVEVAAMINNIGLADGEASLVLELVESSGARTRLDARTMNVQSGEQVLFQYLWKPGREGTQWLELSIINGPDAQSSTVLVDEARSEGVLGSIGSVNPVLLTVVGLLVLGLVGLLVVGLRREPSAQLTAPRTPKTVPSVTAAPVSPPQGPYGAATEVNSPGNNPYQ